MREEKIKTEWATLEMMENDGVIVHVNNNEAMYCLQFNSLKELKQLIETKQLHVKKWIITVPRSSCILKPLTLPATNMAEAYKMVEFEIPSLVPLALSEIVYGCTTVGRQGDMLSVLVSILKLNTLNQILEPFESVGIKPHRVTLEPLALHNWFSIEEPTVSAPQINVFVNEYSCCILTSIDGNLHKVIELPLSSKDFTVPPRKIVEEIMLQQEQLSQSLREELAISLSGVKEYTTEIKKRLLNLPATPFSDKITIITTPKISYFKDVEAEQSKDIFKNGYNAAIAAGLFDLATNSKHPYSNLLPKQQITKSQRKALLSNCLIAGSELLLLVMLLWLCLWASNWRIERASRKIEAQIAPIEHIASSVDSKRQRVKAIQDQLSNRGQITQIFEDLYKYTPKAISISELRFKFGHNEANIEMQGHADLLANAFEYTDAMRKAVLLNEIQIINAQQIPRPGGSIVEFKANCIIHSN
ncbi:hypothetical protein ACFL3G_09935 [Planctomycetota bacterium]